MSNKFQKQSNSHDSKTNEEVEELLELFTEEMKIENERLHEMILKFTQKNHQQKDLDESTIIESEETVTDLKESDDKHFSKETNEVLTLAQKGYNAEEIAKMLHRGKGEVELLLKFYR
ncbi:MAG: DUF6115 domain-containing protein [Bacillota bacterium]